MDDLEGAVLNVFMDKMMLNVYMFSALLTMRILERSITLQFPIKMVVEISFNSYPSLINICCSQNPWRVLCDLDIYCLL